MRYQIQVQVSGKWFNVRGTISAVQADVYRRIYGQDPTIRIVEVSQ